MSRMRTIIEGEKLVRFHIGLLREIVQTAPSIWADLLNYDGTPTTVMEAWEKLCSACGTVF